MMTAMGEFGWVTADPWGLVPGSVPAAPGMPVLLDPELPGAPELPVAPGAEPDVDPLVTLAVGTGRVRGLDVYAAHSFPASIRPVWVRASVARRLATASALLPPGYSLVVMDGWRDLRLQEFLHRRAYAAPGLEPGFVAPVSTDPSRPAPHHTGGTVDLTLAWRGTPLGLGTHFDEFSQRAFAASLEAATTARDRQARALRRLLRAVMLAQGFVGLAREWWHFEYGTRLWSAVTGEPVRYLAAPRP